MPAIVDIIVSQQGIVTPRGKVMLIKRVVATVSIFVAIVVAKVVTVVVAMDK